MHHIHDAHPNTKNTKTLCGVSPLGEEIIPARDVEGRVGPWLCACCLEVWRQEFEGTHWSLTGTWARYRRDPDSVSDQDRFRFNCEAANVLGRPHDHAPECVGAISESYAFVTSKDVTPEVWGRWKEFRGVIERADAAGRVRWRE